MMLKIVTLFLVFIGVLAMFGKLRWLSLSTKRPGRCSHCGRPRIGKGTCPCKSGSA